MSLVLLNYNRTNVEIVRLDTIYPVYDPSNDPMSDIGVVKKRPLIEDFVINGDSCKVCANRVGNCGKGRQNKIL